MSAVTTAVILAAGRGLRIAGEVTDRPKGFIQFGELPIVEESIEQLRDAGIRDVIIVTGHLAGWYEALAARMHGLVRTVHNARYAESGSMYSLWCTRTLVQGPFLLLESDLVYEPRALSTLLAGPAQDAILLSGPTGAGDEIWVQVKDGRLADMSKRRADLGGRPAGELVGITRVSAPLYALMCTIAERTFRNTLHFDYETGCLVAAGRERPIACPLVRDLVWGEIDDPTHLARVRERIYAEVRSLREGPVARPRR
ncbi:MAG: phosphocholine cytidylyltransferase family protein [Gammaproteobacteria bacterium]